MAQLLERADERALARALAHADRAGVAETEAFESRRRLLNESVAGINRSVALVQRELEMARRMAVEEGIFCGISAAGALAITLRLAKGVENATFVFIVCDRGDRYLSTGVFPG